MEVSEKLHDFEVRCYQCNTSFARGTKRCVHCGGRTSVRPPVELSLAGIPDELRSGPAEEEELGPRSSAARSAIWIVTALVAIAGSMLRMCQ